MYTVMITSGTVVIVIALILTVYYDYQLRASRNLISFCRRYGMTEEVSEVLREHNKMVKDNNKAVFAIGIGSLSVIIGAAIKTFLI